MLDIDNTRIHTDLEVQQLLNAPIVSGRVNVTEFGLSDWASILHIPTLANMTLDLDFKSDFQLDTGKGQLSLQNLTVSGPQLELDGNINANGLNG